MIRITLALLSIGFGVLTAEPRFVYPLPEASTMAIQTDLVYKTIAKQDLHFDLYRPTNYASRRGLPVVVFMQGVGSGDVRKWAQYTGWGKLVTTIGMAGVVYDSHEAGVAEDATDLLDYLRRHAEELHLDGANVVLWSCSANVRAGLPLAMGVGQTAIKAAVFYYGVVEEIKELRMDLPMLVVRAGLDGVSLNRGIDRLVARASAMNVPLTFINMPAAHHAFDIMDDNDASRDVIARTLDFMKTQTSPSAQSRVLSGVADATAAASVYREDWTAAIKAYEALTGRRPRDPELHRNFGNALYGQGNSSGPSPSMNGLWSWVIPMSAGSPTPLLPPG